MKQKLTTLEVAQRVQQIKAVQDDPEAAHDLEDRLWQDVLEAIRDGSDTPRSLAHAALRTLELGFPRWAA